MAVAVRVTELTAAVSGEDDRALIGRIRRGDRLAFGALYDRHAPVLLAAAVRILGAPREAQDLLHDVFLEAWQRAEDYDPDRGSVRTWLLVRLRSRALDRLGTAEATRTRSLEEALLDVDLSRIRAATPNDSIDRLAVRQALQRVPPDVREVLELTYFRGFTAKEIGRLIGVPSGTVKSRLARGLAVLADLLKSGEEHSR